MDRDPQRLEEGEVRRPAASDVVIGVHERQYPEATAGG